MAQNVIDMRYRRIIGESLCAIFCKYGRVCNSDCIVIQYGWDEIKKMQFKDFLQEKEIKQTVKVNL